MKSIAKAILVAALIAGPMAVQAQKPALTQNIDEKGRVPYQEAVETVCPNTCIVAFPTVLAGYRLVITNISGYYFSTVIDFNQIRLQGAASIPETPTTVNPAFVVKPDLDGTVNGSNDFSFNASVLMYFNPGWYPALYVYGGSLSGIFTISGYLIANP